MIIGQKDLFGNPICDEVIKINIYADEIQEKRCPYTQEKWFYIGIIVEKLTEPLLDDIIRERYCDNYDKNSPFFKKNDRRIHWSELSDADTMNICKRWFNYILNPALSGSKFFSYILGINDSKLNREKFNQENLFFSKYNRFFRSAILYALKTFFPNKKIIVANVFHEEGQQKYHDYFPWHCIYKIESTEKNINFECNEIVFLPKNHRLDKRSNIIQLCDAFMGACTSIIHGIASNKANKFKKQLMDMLLPLMKKMINEPYRHDEYYNHANRIMIRFFPRKNLPPEDLDKLLLNQFYTERSLFYEQLISGQLKLCLEKDGY